MKVNEVKEWYVSNEKLFFASLELTQNCNFGCKHCYCSDKQSDNLSLEEYICIIDKLHKTGCLYLNFTGGEIFTNKDFKEIYTYAKNRGFMIDLLTNISLLDDELIDLFKKLPPSNIAITIYGVNEEDYLNFTGNGNNFNRTIKALDLLKSHDIPFVLRTVATKTLKKSLMEGEFEKLAKEYNTSFKYDTIVFPKISGDITPLNESLTISEIIELEGKAEERMKSWEKEINTDEKYEWSCQGGVSSMALDFQGNAFVCGLYRKNPISLVDNDIDDVMKHLKEIHQEHVEIVNTNECSVCSKRKVCKWCPAYAFVFNNDENGRIPFFCGLAEARVDTFG